MDGSRHSSGDLLHRSLAALGSRPDAPDQAVLVDLTGPRLYFFFIEIWPQEIYYLTGLLIMARHRAVPGDLAGRTHLVRLCLPADGLDRPLRLGRAQNRRRPVGTHPPRQEPLEYAEGPEEAFQASGMAGDRLSHRRRLGDVLHRRAHPGRRSRQVPGRRAVPVLHRPLHRPPHICWAAGRGSRSAPTCAPGRGSKAP